MKRILPTTAEVERRLKDEARILRIRPQYSPLLHQRILASLQEGGLSVDSPPPRRRMMPAVWRIGIPTGIAAAIAVAAWIALHPASPALRSPNIVVRPPNSQPQVATQ